MKYLFDHWADFSSLVSRSRRVFLFLDYDGTLAPIVSRPEYARLPGPVKKTIRTLRRQRGITVAIISGRSLKDIKKIIEQMLW